MADEAPGPLTALIQGGAAVPKSVAKLIDTVGEQVGLWLKPWHTRRQGQAEASVRIEDAKADVEIETIEVKGRLAIKDIRTRAVERSRQKEERRQSNVEKITADACQQMPAEVSDIPVEPDWITQFFDHCQDVSDEQMQSVWSKILSCEVARPGSFSLKALVTVKVLTKADAERFNRLGSTFWQTGMLRDLFIFDPGRLYLYQEMRISEKDILSLVEAGLIRMTEGVLTRSHALEPQVKYTYHGQPFIFSTWRNALLPIGRIELTSIGSELATLVNSRPCDAFRIDTIEWLRRNGWLVDYNTAT